MTLSVNTLFDKGRIKKNVICHKPGLDRSGETCISEKRDVATN